MNTAVDARVVSNNYFSADWFYVTFVATTDSSFPVSYWASVRKPLIEVQLSVDETNAFESMIVGYVDTVTAVRSITE